MANDDYKIDNTEVEEWEERNIAHWVSNGLEKAEAEQLMYDIKNDANFSDPDMDVFADQSIQDKVDKYNGFIN